ncbi:hypothetical protein TNCV_3228671 [Trichonephila clavipes]|nr:hypothetical protein TNCV_3228671 [Trichonephila clavipes]
MNYRIFVNIYEQINGVAYDHYYREKKGPERDQDGMFQQRDKFGMQAAFEDFKFREALQHIIFLEVLFAEEWHGDLWTRRGIRVTSSSRAETPSGFGGKKVLSNSSELTNMCKVPGLDTDNHVVY